MLLLAQAMNNHGPDASRYVMPIEDMKVWARLWFSSCAIQACKRDANRAAHAVARLGYSCDVNPAFLWEDDVPAVAANVVVGEMPILPAGYTYAQIGRAHV